MAWNKHLYTSVGKQIGIVKLIDSYQQDSTTFSKKRSKKRSQKRSTKKCTKKTNNMEWSKHAYPEVMKHLHMETLMLVPGPPAWPPQLFRHQQEGVEWMLKRDKDKRFPGGLLCDEPGMGKTIQIGCTMALNPVKNTLIILPNAVVQQWCDTMGKMFPQANIYIHHGKTKITDASVLDDSTMNIVIVTIAGIQNPKFESKKKSKKTKRRKNYSMKVFKNLVWDRIIMDECHYIKNKNSMRSRSACALLGTIRWGMTGTPVQNSINDLITLLMFIKPHGWDQAKFPINEPSLKFYKKKLLLRRTKLDHPIDPEHPITISTIKDITVTFPFATSKERELYEVTLSHIETTVDDTLSDASESNIAKFQCVLELLLRARQLSIHPQVYLDGIKRRADRLGTEYVSYSDEETNYDYRTLSSRFHKVLQYIEEGRDTNQLVFCRYTSEMDLWENVLTQRGIRCCKYNGSTPFEEREMIINSFTLENPGGVLLIQIMAGGVGLNLQQFTRVMLTTPDWNPSNEIQAVARSHRIGQAQQVEVFRFILDDPECEKTIDTQIMEVQKNKRLIMADLLEDESLYTDCKLSLIEIQSMIKQKKKNFIENITFDF